MITRIPELSDFHDQMVAWRARGLSLQEIAERLLARNVPASKGKIYDHFLKYKFRTPEIGKNPLAGKPLEVAEKRTSLASADRSGTAAPAAVLRAKGKPHPLPPGPMAPTVGSAVPPTVSSAPPAVSPASFPDIDRHRKRILACIQVGFTASEICATLHHTCGVRTTVERVRQYLEGLLEERFPTGTVRPDLYRIQTPAHQWPNDLPMLRFGHGTEADTLALNALFLGVMVTGAIGSGKTSGSGALLAASCLSAGCGFLILTTKPEEAQEWIERVKMAGRESDLSVIRPDGYLTLDAIAYEFNQPSGGGQFVDNLMGLFKNLLGALGSDHGPTMTDAFWRLSGDELLRSLLGVFIAAKIPVTIERMARFLVHAPQDLDAVEGWRSIPHFGHVLGQAQANARTAEEKDDVERLFEYWTREFCGLPSGTRGCIVIGFTSMINALRSPRIRRLVAGRTTLAPTAPLNGRIVIVDLPINIFHEAGLLVQSIFKFMVQRAILTRPDKALGKAMRPVVIWADEAQNFFLPFDSEFYRVARDRRAISVNLTQSITNIIDKFGGGDAARVKTQSILANLNIRIYHCNGCLETNRMVSESLGTYEKQVTETSSSPQTYNGIDPFMSAFYKFFKKPHITTSHRVVRESFLQPNDFVSLKPGGEESGYRTEAILTQVGRRFAGDLPYRRVEFQQILLPQADGDIDLRTAAEQFLRKSP